MKHIGLLIIILIVISCSKDDDETFNPCPDINPNVKLTSCFDNFFFDTGSYWIYQNTNNLVIDCTYVKDWLYTPSSQCETEYYSLHMQSSFSLPFQPNQYYHVLRENTWKSNSVPSGVAGWSDDNFCTNSIIDSMIVNGTVYYDVIEGGYSLNTMYFKENVGIIRIVDTLGIGNNNVVYDLVNYQASLFQRQ